MSTNTKTRTPARRDVPSRSDFAILVGGWMVAGFVLAVEATRALIPTASAAPLPAHVDAAAECRADRAALDHDLRLAMATCAAMRRSEAPR